jgi:uncharacterized membrane protein
LRTVTLAAAIFFAAYLWLDINQLRALRTNQNTGLYLQTLVNLADHGSTFNFADGKPHAQVHNQWIVYLLAPLVRAAPRAETLIAVQVLVLAAAAPVLFALARSLGAPETSATAIAVAYLLAPSTQGFAYGGFVPETALPLLGFALALGIIRRSYPIAITAAVLLTGVKEDQALFLLWFAAAVTVLRDRRLGLSLAAVAVFIGLVPYAVYAGMAGFRPERPEYGLADHEIPQQLGFIAEAMVPLAFAPIALGPRMLLALPVAAELFLAQNHPIAMYRAGSYYTASFVTLATIGAAFVLAKNVRWAQFGLAGAAVMALFFNQSSVLHLGRKPFTTDPQYAVARAWSVSDRPVEFPCVDEGAWVVASANPQARLAGCGSGLDRLRSAWRDEPLASHAAWTSGPPG